MKIRFVRIDNNALTDEFQMKDNPFKVGDEIDLEAWKVVTDEDTDESQSVINANFQGIFRIVSIRHEVQLEQFMGTCCDYKCTNVLIKPC